MVTQAVVYASQDERIAFAGSVQLSSKGVRNGAQLRADLV